MNIQLPNDFNFCKKGELLAWIEKEGKNKVLKILPQYDKMGGQFIQFRSIMTELTYVLKGRNVCSYCGNEFDVTDMSIDHLYPFSLVGPTIPENLAPACKTHNNEKGFFTVEEYSKYRMLSITEREIFKKRMENEHMQKRKSGIEIVPEYFFTKENIGHIIVPFNMMNTIYTSSFKSVVKYYNEYGLYKYPIVLDRKNYLLDGFYVVFLAMKKEDKSLKVVKLENVDVIL